MSGVNLYDVLEVSNDATPTEIKNAYRKLVKKFHPDKPKGDAEMFELISDAYNKLSSEETRKEYDILYKLSEQSKKGHTNLKNQADQYYKSQDTSVTNKKSKDELKNEFISVMADMDKKHNYKRDDDEEPIPEESLNRRFDDLTMCREQDDIELTHENLFEDTQYSDNKFNAAWDAMHGGPNEIIPHSGNPLGWGGFQGDNAGYSTIDGQSELYVENDLNIGVEGQDYSNINFEKDIKKKINKNDLNKIKNADYTSNHNSIDENYNKSLDEKLAERKLDDNKYDERERSDFNTDPSCDGYGVYADLGISGQSLQWDNDEDDIRKKYERLIELRK